MHSCASALYSGIYHLRQVPEHSGFALGLLIPVPDWFPYRHFFSFRYRTVRRSVVWNSDIFDTKYRLSIG
jgi:hypothetical protein